MITIPTFNLTNEGEDFSGEEPADMLDIEESDLITPSSPVSYELHAALVNNGMLVTGEASATIRCVCVRCLAEKTVTIQTEDVCHFRENPLPSEIDLTSEIREDIIIDFPQNFVCSESCKGLCFVCGQNLNEKICGCDKDKSGNPAWNELDKLNIETQGKE